VIIAKEDIVIINSNHVAITNSNVAGTTIVGNPFMSALITE